jgi:hypothetical protein
VSTELSHILSYDLNKDDSLSSSTPLRVCLWNHLQYRYLWVYNTV